MENLDFWNRVKALLKQKKITQEVLAKTANLNYSNLKQQIFYNRIPKAEEAAKIAAALNVSTEYLLYGEENISDIEAALILKFRKLTEDQKKLVMGVVANFAAK